MQGTLDAFRAMSRYGIQGFQLSRLRSVKVPALVLWGAQDTVGLRSRRTQIGAGTAGAVPPARGGRTSLDARRSRSDRRRDRLIRATLRRVVASSDEATLAHSTSASLTQRAKQPRGPFQ